MSGQCMQPNITSLHGSEQPKSFSRAVCEDHALLHPLSGQKRLKGQLWNSSSSSRAQQHTHRHPTSSVITPDSWWGLCFRCPPGHAERQLL